MVVAVSSAQFRASIGSCVARGISNKFGFCRRSVNYSGTSYELPGTCSFQVNRNALLPTKPIGSPLLIRQPASYQRVVSLNTSSSTQIKEPTTSQLRTLALRAAIPMIGFGAMDNFVMLQAGELIDASIGVTFALSTLTAAGFGQIFSDVAGITCGGIVDAAVSKMNLPYHGLTIEQLQLKRCRMWSTAGGCIGVITGCLLGMSCLFFMDTDKAERLKKAKELTSIFKSVVRDGHKLVNAERATIWLLDEEKGEIWSRVSTGLEAEIRVASNAGVVGSCVQTGNVIIINDAYKDVRFNPQVDKKTGYHTDTIIAVPVKNKNGIVIGAIQMINKRSGDGAEKKTFTEEDVKLLQMMSSHVATFIEVVNGGDS